MFLRVTDNINYRSMKHSIVGLLAAILLLSPCKGFGETPSLEQISQARKMAGQGNAEAQLVLGSSYYLGEVVPKSDTEALKWFRRAAQQENADAQFSLGLMHYEGQGVPESDTEALKWFRLAAQQGFAKAQAALKSLGEK